jgi:NAD-dependent SIR2 family protein deacetylase
LECPNCEEQIAAEQIVRPRFDYVLCPYCQQEFVPQVFLL